MSAKAQQVAKQKPEYWGLQLFAVLLIENLASANMVYSSSDPSATPVRFENISQWAIERLDEVKGKLTEFEGSWRANETKVFGLPSSEGDMEAITGLVSAVVDFYVWMHKWSQSIKQTKVDSRCGEFRDELALCTSEMIGAIDDFGPALLHQVRIATHSESTSNVIVPLKLFLPDISHAVAAAQKAASQVNAGGYLYVLINPSMNGLVKIGKTARNPRERVKELSSPTGVPTPFVLVFDAYFNDCDSAERLIHQELENRNARVSSGREFFKIEVNEVVKLIADFQSRINYI